MTEPKLVVATGNAHKIEEIKEILSSLGSPEDRLGTDDLSSIVTIRDFTEEEPIENGVSFRENALLKAQFAAKATNLPALADDSGLTVEVMGGCPGIFSARWSGSHGDDKANRQLLLKQMTDVEVQNRKAAFICVVALAYPDGTSEVVEGRMDGQIALAESEAKGWGYDPVFIPEGYDQTVAALSSDKKNQISHRFNALKKIHPAVVRLLHRS